MALALGMYPWRCGPYQVCTNDDSWLTLTYFIARSILISNAFILEKSSIVHIFITIQAKIIIQMYLLVMYMYTHILISFSQKNTGLTEVKL